MFFMKSSDNIFIFSGKYKPLSGAKPLIKASLKDKSLISLDFDKKLPINKIYTCFCDNDKCKFRKPNIGMLKNMPLSKVPSPNWSDVTSVNDAKTPNSVPFIKDLENSKVVNSIGVSILIEIIEKLQEVDGKLGYYNLAPIVF